MWPCSSPDASPYLSSHIGMEEEWLAATNNWLCQLPARLHMPLPHYQMYVIYNILQIVTGTRNSLHPNHVKQQHYIFIVCVYTLQHAEAHTETRWRGTAIQKVNTLQLVNAVKGTPLKVKHNIIQFQTVLYTPPTVPCTFNIESHVQWSPCNVDFFWNEKRRSRGVSIAGESFH